MRGTVTLLGIRMLRTPQGWRVQLTFQDEHGKNHATAYALDRFKIALTQGIVRQREKALGALSTLSIFPGEGSNHSFFHWFDDGFIGYLGDPSTGAARHLLQMFYAQAARDSQLRKALDAPRTFTLSNPYK